MRFINTSGILAVLSVALSSRAEETDGQQHRRDVANGYDVTDPTRYPYFVRFDFNGSPECGGTLIHREFILTAAHCFYEGETIDALVGGVINATDFDIDLLTIPVDDPLTIHPLYDDFDGTSDVALYQVDPVYWADPIGGGMESRPQNETLRAGDPVTVIGFGKIETQGFIDELQEADLFITSDDLCNAENRRTGGIDGPSMICALDAESSQDACGADSGGPLIVKGSDASEDVLVGVVSTGDGKCGQNTKAGVYSEVAYFYDWIQYQICQNAVNPPPPEICANLTDPTEGQKPIKLSSPASSLGSTTSLNAMTVLSLAALVFS